MDQDLTLEEDDGDTCVGNAVVEESVSVLLT